MNIYRVTNVETGEAYEGGANEFRHLNLSNTTVYDCARKGSVAKNKYMVECIVEQRGMFKKKDKESEMTELEKWNARAREHGMDYGNYVSFVDGMGKLERKKENIA